VARSLTRDAIVQNRVAATARDLSRLTRFKQCTSRGKTFIHRTRTERSNCTPTLTSTPRLVTVETFLYQRSKRSQQHIQRPTACSYPDCYVPDQVADQLDMSPFGETTSVCTDLVYKHLQGRVSISDSIVLKHKLHVYRGKFGLRQPVRKAETEIDCSNPSNQHGSLQCTLRCENVVAIIEARTTFVAVGESQRR
jgi:hypothetical protein